MVTRITGDAGSYNQALMPITSLLKCLAATSYARGMRDHFCLQRDILRLERLWRTATGLVDEYKEWLWALTLQDNKQAF